MAVNPDKLMEKLKQLQIKFDRPKIALKECNKRLQKHPKDPYMLAWKFGLLSETDPEAAWLVYHDLCKLNPSITDKNLLLQIYFVAVTTKQCDGERCNFAPPEIQALWLNVAKSMKLRSERVIALQEILAAAVQTDCWGDAQSALLHLRKELPNDANCYFLYIAASQLSSSKLKLIGKKNESDLAGILAYRHVLKAIQNSSSKSASMERITSARQLRFVAQIYKHHGRWKELIELLNCDQEYVQSIIAANQVEFVQLKLTGMEQAQMWQPLWEFTVGLLTRSVKPSGEITWGNDWKLWRSMLLAIEMLPPSEENKKTASDLIAFSCEHKPSREAFLAWMTFAARCCHNRLLTICQKYWDAFSGFNCCFDDLRKFVEQFDSKQRKAFLNHASKAAHAAGLKEKHNQDWSRWLQTEINSLKFDYLLSISRPNTRKRTVIEPFVINCLDLYHLSNEIGHEPNPELGVLAIMGLVHLAIMLGSPDDGHLMLQAGALAHFLHVQQKDHKNRPLLLLSIRLHLFLGFGSYALSLWPFLGVKEILLETVSHTLLSQISINHPFDSGPNASVHSHQSTRLASPDGILRDTIRTFSRTLGKLNQFLGADFTQLEYDQVLENSEFRDQLEYSLVKHMWILERRRIARLSGVPCDQEDLGLVKSHLESLKDHRDMNVGPNFESTGSQGLDALLFPLGYPDEYWFSNAVLVDEICSTLARESPMIRNRDTRYILEKIQPNPVSLTLGRLENLFMNGWGSIRAITAQVVLDEEWGNIPISETFQTLNNWFQIVEQMIPKWGVIFGNTIYPKSRMLQLFFQVLEILQAVSRLCDSAFACLKKKTSRLKGKFTKEDVDKLALLTEGVYKSIRKCADDKIQSVQRDGVKPFLASFRHGATGACLEKTFNHEALLDAAKEFAHSTEDAVSGILKVKLK
ncbi:hypothetical protein K432DRAFT_428168 [Lepidopterella palustris CBS 459.81]|uniref:Uncharacterized protein n=1 Tax=Lepidopterella palustris CBS 459.81 TaxID=1314670 RepID=A0A8E2JCC9_9PEZI|nr:hypothetical protein K432DRAFT_428168 [Lepidopterella palustris CBS 459.81]